VARAVHEVLRALAEACAVGADGRPDPRCLDERMADCFADVFLRPDAEGRSPVQVLLTLVAGVGTLTGSGPDADEPGEIDGDTVPAALVRELAYAFGLMPRPAPAAGPDAAADGADAADAAAAPAGPAVGPQAAPAEDTAPAEGSAQAEGSAPTKGSAPDRTDETAAVTEVRTQAALASLLDVRRLADTALAERPRIAVVDQLTGCLLALTDSTELRAAVRTGRGLSPPEATDGYRPSDPLDRFVRLRDRRCRFPGCRARIRKCDLDHRVPYPHGPTAHTNLEGLCEFHHRLSHQAPGWRLGGHSDGGLVWTLPGGSTITTVPPRFGTDDGNDDAPHRHRGTTGGGIDWRHLRSAERRARLRDLVCGRPARPGDEPAGF
jgi:hypothetical protein